MKVDCERSQAKFRFRKEMDFYRRKFPTRPLFSSPWLDTSPSSSVIEAGILESRVWLPSNASQANLFKPAFLLRGRRIVNRP
jgi:hypothetical protein